MTYRKLLFFLYLLLLIPLLPSAQEAKTKIFHTEGDWLERTPMHNHHVYDILQDSRGIMWFATNAGLIKFDGADFTVYYHDPNEINSLGSITPLRLLEDKQGKIWVTVHNGISVFDPKLETFTNYYEIPLDEGAFSYNYIHSLELDKNGTIWLGTDRGLCNYSPKEKKFTCFPEFAFGIGDLEMENDSILWIANYKPNLIKLNTHSREYSEVQIFDENGNRITKGIGRILITGQGDFWVYSYPGFLYRRKRDNLHQNGAYFFHHLSEMAGVAVFEMESSKNGDIWLTGKQGIYYFDNKQERFSSIAFEGYGEAANREYFTFFEDNRSSFWVGYENGVFKWDGEQKSSFIIYSDFPSQKKDKAHIYSYGVTRFEKLDSHRILVGNDGLYIFDQKENKITPAAATFPQLSGLDTLPIDFLFKDSQSGIWISSPWAPLTRFDLNTKKIVRENQIRTETFVIVEGKNHTLWMGTSEGLVHYHLKKGILKRYLHDPNNPNSLSDNDVQSLALEHDSLLWIGTRGGGLNCLNIKTEQFNRFRHDRHDPKSLSNNQVVDLHIDGESRLWVATYGGGLCRLDKSRQGFERFLKQQGLNTLQIAAIEEDGQHRIWVGTSEGVSAFDRNSGMFQNYNVNKGAPFLVSWISGVKDSDGFLYFGGVNSFVRFHPENVKKDTVAPRLVFTEFYLNNELVLPQQKNSPLAEGISFTNSITLKHHQNFIRLKFAALNFIQPEKNQYAYRMEGLLHEWQFLGGKHEVSFTNLDAGEYVLHVKGANQEGFWNEKGISLKITILPPWYRTWWAYLLWAAIILGSAYWFYRFQLHRQLAEAEALRLKELDLAKSRLYTNITHEFRTPLTVILGMAEQVKSDPKNWFNEGLKLIRRNGKQLLELVNQMLDLSKLESGNMPLKMVQGDIISYLHYLTESFHSYADNKDIRLHFLTELTELQMDYDPEKLQNVVSNLLSNAIKFTPAGGDIYVTINHGDFENHHDLVLSVKDTGTGIAAEHLPYIFDRFYQADETHTRRGEGTGIGLALTKELVKVMGGNIEVESEESAGTKFTIRLPVTRLAFPPPPLTPPLTPKGEPEPGSLEGIILERSAENTNYGSPSGVRGGGGKSLILLIEDNADVITYLGSFLSSVYQIVTTTNGQEGIEKAIELIPDLIVSDVMMPEKDGFEVCATLKTDERTNHIPVILLTAKSDQPSKIAGLKHGADAYLSKPFNKEELLVRMEKLIELRRQLQLRFQKPGSLREVLRTKARHPDEIFLQKVIRIVEANLADEDFGMHELCKAVNMSRSNLFRKLKALTGKSTTVFIRSLRLEKARELLETTGLTVSEVGYETGFNNPKYFSRVFQEEFGMPPSGVRK